MLEAFKSKMNMEKYLLDFVILRLLVISLEVWVGGGSSYWIRVS